jgi:hypothetical protein
LPKRPESTFAYFANSIFFSMLQAKVDFNSDSLTASPQTPAATFKRLYANCPTGDPGDTRVLRGGRSR